MPNPPPRWSAGCRGSWDGRTWSVITGPPGAGKSTLVGALVRQFLQLGQRVAVLAVDPSSPVTGGALLGDRFRIGECADDGRCFVRSTATRGSLGGLTAAARQMVRLMDAAGYDLVMVETVGTGQSEVDVAQLADSLLVIFPPGWATNCRRSRPASWNWPTCWW
jgi:LAO/AO transport system kinase